MRTRFYSHVAVGALATTLLVVGCNPGSQGRVASVSSRAPSAAKAAAQFAAMGETAMRNHNGPLAVAMAERAVASQPGVARYRAQLGQSYLLAGRFASAIDAFRDAVAVAPDDGRAMLGMALAQAALDRQEAARASVAAAEGRIGASDRGLALALAGDSDGAIALLEPAARMRDATPKTRQNLALAYALAGRWDVARATAAQDVAADRLDARMQSWAALARPQPRVDRVAAFLGVTPVAVDEGMPAQLALGATAPTTGPTTGPLPAAAPVAIALADTPARPTMQSEPEPAPIAMVTGDIAAPSPLPPVASAAPAMRDGMMLERQVTRAPIQAASMPAGPLAVRPERPARARVLPPALLMRAAYAPPARGRWAVQLGAFSSGRSIEDAWNRVSHTVHPVAGMVPLSSTVRARGILFQRLAVGGLASRADAVTLCQQVRAARGVCFVRAATSEAPMQMAGRRTTAAQIASR